MWVSEPERGFSLASGLGLQLDVICPFQLLVGADAGDAGMAENRPGAPQQVGQVRAALEGTPAARSPSCSTRMCCRGVPGDDTMVSALPSGEAEGKQVPGWG